MIGFLCCNVESSYLWWVFPILVSIVMVFLCIVSIIIFSIVRYNGSFLFLICCRHCLWVLKKGRNSCLTDWEVLFILISNYIGILLQIKRYYPFMFQIMEGFYFNAFFRNSLYYWNLYLSVYVMNHRILEFRVKETHCVFNSCLVHHLLKESAEIYSGIPVDLYST